MHPASHPAPCSLIQPQVLPAQTRRARLLPRNDIACVATHPDIHIGIGDHLARLRALASGLLLEKKPAIYMHRAGSTVPSRERRPCWRAARAPTHSGQRHRRSVPGLWQTRPPRTLPAHPARVAAVRLSIIPAPAWSREPPRPRPLRWESTAAGAAARQPAMTAATGCTSAPH